MQTRESTSRWLSLAAAAVLSLSVVVQAVPDDNDNMMGEVKSARAALPGLEKGDTLSPLFHTVAQVARPAVVMVEVAERIKQTQTLDSGARSFLRHLFGNSIGQLLPPEYEYVYGLGSGIVVDANNGYILTNWHVVHGADTVEVILADKRHFKTQWVRTDQLTDLAVIKIDAGDLISIPLGDSSQIVVGDWVLAVGAPEGLPQTVTAGIISAKGRTVGKDYESFFQTDAAINPGNSGGPLMSMKGEVIGINTAIVSPERINAGIGLAIPSNTAKYVMTQLIEKGKVIRGYVGLEVQDVSERLAKSFDLPTTKGALVASVVPDGPAAKAGIEPEDFITAVGGKPVDDSPALRRAVMESSPGEKVPFELYRKGEKRTVEVQIEALPEKASAAPAAPQAAASGRFGISMTTLTPDLAHKYGYPTSLKGVLITAVQPGSEASFVGLVPGMVILQIQGESVTSGGQAEKILSSSKASAGVRLLVTDPSGARVYIFVQAGS
jgi:serine protease Do